MSELENIRLKKEIVYSLVFGKAPADESTLESFRAKQENDPPDTKKLRQEILRDIKDIRGLERPFNDWLLGALWGQYEQDERRASDYAARQHYPALDTFPTAGQLYLEEQDNAEYMRGFD